MTPPAAHHGARAHAVEPPANAEPLLIPEVAPLLAAWASRRCAASRNCFVVCPVSVLSSTHMVPPGELLQGDF
jgi:hypothetical protein